MLPSLEGGGAEAGWSQETGVIDPRNEETDSKSMRVTNRRPKALLPSRFGRTSGNEASGCEEPQREPYQDHLRNY